MKILIASNNTHKIEEFKSILDDIENIELITPKTLDISIVPEENGKTFLDNSIIKAQSFYEIAEIPVIADDSGLEIDILNGEPGTFSSRYAGDNATDQENRQKVIKLLKKMGKQIFDARFKCVITYIDLSGIYSFDGKVEGQIILEERGKNGFGYDSIFVPNDFNVTFAELENEIKNKISHRANALIKLKAFLKNKTTIDE